MEEHPIFKLGKAPAKADPRNLMFAALALAEPKLPAAYDFDLTHTGIPTPMFANETYGCCVIAGRAHQTLRFEDIEQSAVLQITDREVLKEYFKETGGEGVDTGLVVLDSLSTWRRRGWKAAGKSYKIKAYAQVNYHNRENVKLAIFANVGVGLGVSLPISAQAQVQSGQPWAVTRGANAAKGSWGGHYIYCSGYAAAGPVCITWGRKQQMTWEWLAKYGDEAYTIFDAVDRPKRAKLINLAMVDDFLSGLTA